MGKYSDEQWQTSMYMVRSGASWKKNQFSFIPEDTTKSLSGLEIVLSLLHTPQIALESYRKMSWSNFMS